MSESSRDVKCAMCNESAVIGSKLCIYHIRRRGKKFNELKIKGKTFENVYLVESIFENVVLEDCDFVNSKLTNIKFLNSVIINCKFENVDMVLSQVVNSKIENSKFRETDFSRARIISSDIINCDFREDIDFSESHLKKTNIKNSNMFSVDFSFSILNKVEFDGCDLTGSSFGTCNLSDTSFIETTLDDVDMCRSVCQNFRMINCDMRYSDLSDANLSSSTIENVDLSHSQLTNTDLRDASLFQTVFEFSTLKNAKIDEIVLEERLANKTENKEEKRLFYEKAEKIYREFKTYFSKEGIYDRASHYYYREKLMSRKKRPLIDPLKYMSLAVDVLCGYGEKPFRLIAWWIFVIFGFAVTFFFIDKNLDSFSSSLYLSYLLFFGLPRELFAYDQYNILMTLLFIFESTLGKIFIGFLYFLISRKMREL